MGEVYQASDTTLDRDVALKVSVVCAVADAATARDISTHRPWVDPDISGTASTMVDNPETAALSRCQTRTRVSA